MKTNPMNEIIKRLEAAIAESNTLMNTTSMKCVVITQADATKIADALKGREEKWDDNEIILTYNGVLQNVGTCIKISDMPTAEEYLADLKKRRGIAAQPKAEPDWEKVSEESLPIEFIMQSMGYSKKTVMQLFETWKSKQG